MHQNSPLKSHKGLQCFLSFLQSLYYFSCQYFSTKSTSLTVYISFSNPHQLRSWVWLVKVLFSNREHCGYTCIVVSEGQVKNDCSAGTEKQKIWKKKFHIWKIELLYWAVLKYKSAHKSKYECIYPKKYLLCVSLRCYVCTLQFRNCSSVLACKLSFLTHELWPFSSILWNFVQTEWSNVVLKGAQVIADLKRGVQTGKSSHRHCSILQLYVLWLYCP